MKKFNKLSAKAVAAIRKPGRHGDGQCLYLMVSKTGGKFWVFRYMVAGRPREMGLGPVHLVSLGAAREKARACRETMLAGSDPLEARRMKVEAIRAKEAMSISFAECAERFIAEHSPSWKSDKHRHQWRVSLKMANDAFGSLNVASVETPMIIHLVTPIYAATPETGNRLRSRVEKVLDWSTAAGFRSGPNPARWKGHFEYLLKARPKRTENHHKALAYADVPAFMARLRDNTSLSARALEFTILAATRTSETLGAKWDEIDIDAGVWTIPAKRMKSGREHRVPLTDRMVAILNALPHDDPFVFPGAKEGQPLSNMAMLELLRGLSGNGFTVHGFRSSFRDWTAERTAFPRDVAEMALAHAVESKTEAAYRRGDLFDKRRRLMTEWSRYCEMAAASASVTALNA